MSRPDDVQLVVHGELDGHDRIAPHMPDVQPAVVPELDVVVDHDEPVRSEEEQDRQGDDVRNEYQFFHGSMCCDSGTCCSGRRPMVTSRRPFPGARPP